MQRPLPYDQAFAEAQREIDFEKILEIMRAAEATAAERIREPGWDERVRSQVMVDRANPNFVAWMKWLTARGREALAELQGPEPVPICVAIGLLYGQAQLSAQAGYLLGRLDAERLMESGECQSSA